MRIKNFILILSFLPLLYSTGCFSDAVSSDEGQARTGPLIFDDAFRSSGQEFTQTYYYNTNRCIVDTLNEQGSSFWVENPIKDIVDLGLSGATQESVDALLQLIHNAVLNPWTLLDNTSLNGTFGCVTWSTGVNFDLQVIQSAYDLFNSDWWTLTVQSSFTNCPSIEGNFLTEISGSRIGVVYQVHVTGTFNVTAIPGEEFDIDIVYNLEECFKTWDCVDWEGTINGITIQDLY